MKETRRVDGPPGYVAWIHTFRCDACGRGITNASDDEAGELPTGWTHRDDIYKCVNCKPMKFYVEQLWIFLTIVFYDLLSWAAHFFTGTSFNWHIPKAYRLLWKIREEVNRVNFDTAKVGEQVSINIVNKTDADITFNASFVATPHRPECITCAECGAVCADGEIEPCGIPDRCPHAHWPQK